jgi:hypothetical protein
MSRKARASERIATEALRRKVMMIPAAALSDMSGVSRGVINRFRDGENIRVSSAEKLRQAVAAYGEEKRAKPVKGKKEAESTSASGRCAILILEDGAEVLLGDLDDVRVAERRAGEVLALICPWCGKAHEGAGCREEDIDH